MLSDEKLPHPQQNLCYIQCMTIVFGCLVSGSCIGGWSWVCHSKIESATTLSDMDAEEIASTSYFCLAAEIDFLDPEV